MQQLVAEQVLPWELVTKKLNIPASTIKSLEMAGIIRQRAEETFRNPVKLEAGSEQRNILSSAQRGIADSILAEFDAGQRRPSLIHGITGSGKTEVYLALIEGMIARGRQAIVLIPEIALTYQTLLRFYRRFGDRVSVMNSSLSPGENRISVNVPGKAKLM